MKHAESQNTAYHWENTISHFPLLGILHLIRLRRSQSEGHYTSLKSGVFQLVIWITGSLMTPTENTRCFSLLSIWKGKKLSPASHPLMLQKYSTFWEKMQTNMVSIISYLKMLLQLMARSASTLSSKFNNKIHLLWIKHL